MKRKLTNEQVIEIRERYASGETIRGLQAEFGLGSSSTVGLLVTGKTYKHIGGPITMKGMLKGEDHPKATLSDDDVARIRRLYATTMFSQKHLAGMFGVSQRSISYYISGGRR